ncbi:flagellar assembly protein FliW, partial [bacterium]|nr:flagellar assembly protein FliW [bacterium]
RGLIRVPRKELIHFPEGLLGFGDYTDFAVLDINDCKPFKSMLSAVTGGPDFVVVEPQLIFSNYNPLKSINALSDLGIGDPVDLVILSLVTLAENPGDITLNLRGPIFINLVTRLARQIILPDDTFRTKEPILPYRKRPRPLAENIQARPIAFNGGSCF